VVLGGDMGNFASISHHNKGQARYKEGMRLKQEMDLIVDLILGPLDDILRSRTKKYWIQGNHEKWIDDHVQEYPELEGLVNLASYLKLEERGWEFYDYGEICKIDYAPVYCCHGDKIKGGINHATWAVNKYHRNMRYGHHHTYQIATEVSPMDVSDFHTAIAVPCLANRNAGYAQNQPNKHIHGFLKGEALSSGLFQDEVIVMVDNKFVVDGRVYEG
jgi:hypothetical protein